METVRSKAIVLGGGGPVGRGWQTGLLTGLMRTGVLLRSADLVVGTSAGAITGALLVADADLTPVTERALRTGTMVTGLAPSRDAAERARFGRAALTGDTMTELESLSRAALAPLDGLAWPAAFRATAVHALDGTFRLFGVNDGVPLQSAVAASAALPGVYPAITVDGEKYVDGGLRSMLNADLADGHDIVLVISCFPIEALDEADVQALLATGAAVVPVTPDERLRNVNMLDPTLVAWAHEVGTDQAAVEARRLGAAWHE